MGSKLLNVTPALLLRMFMFSVVCVDRTDLLDMKHRLRKLRDMSSALSLSANFGQVLRVTTKLVLAFLITVALLGCLKAKSLGKSDGPDRIELTDATTRAITVVSIETEKDGRRVRPRRVICAEPSPDIAKAVSSAIESSLKAKADIPGAGSGALEGAFNRSVTESIAQLGSRLATIQLLRDELSDLCRSYANGAVSSITYTLRLSRLDRKMITLLVSEASAGALSRALVSINGSASIGGQFATPERYNEAEKRIKDAAHSVTDAGKEVTEATTKLNQATDSAAKEAAKVELKKAEEMLRSRLAELGDRVLEKWALETRGTGQLASSTASAIAGIPANPLTSVDLRAIHKAYLDDDDSSTLLDACLTSMEDNLSLQVSSDTNLQNIEGQITTKEQEVLKAENDLSIERKRASSSPSQQIPEADLTKVFNAEATAKQKRLELEQLQRQAAKIGGSVDRTSLLTFCRTSMARITDLIERKISNKYWLELNENQTELCKVALTGEITDDVKMACLKDVIGGGRKF